MKTTFREYLRKQIAELRPVSSDDIAEYYETGKIGNVSISNEHVRNGSPKIGDMIARNPKNHNDQWLVNKKYFNENFEIL